MQCEQDIDTICLILNKKLGRVHELLSQAGTHIQKATYLDSQVQKLRLLYAMSLRLMETFKLE